jgi:curli biogenesis system outer membrane secretion channel CsgG
MRTVTLVVALSVAGTSSAKAQDKDELQKCDKPIGTLAVHEPQQEYMRTFARYSLGSPAALLRMMAQQSKCFVVVERGVALQNMAQERELARAGEMQQDANMGGGQMKAADFIMTAAVQVVDNNAGGAVGWWVGSWAVARRWLARSGADVKAGMTYAEGWVKKSLVAKK